MVGFRPTSDSDGSTGTCSKRHIFPRKCVDLQDPLLFIARSRRSPDLRHTKTEERVHGCMGNHTVSGLRSTEA